MARDGSATPEGAAVAGWAATSAARPRVVEVEVRGERAEVVLELETGHREWVYCQHGPDGWREVTSGNAPTLGWDDPSAIHWDDR
jgi:hypothetical protein